MYDRERRRNSRSSRQNSQRSDDILLNELRSSRTPPPNLSQGRPSSDGQPPPNLSQGRPSSDNQPPPNFSLPLNAASQRRLSSDGQPPPNFSLPLNAASQRRLSSDGQQQTSWLDDASFEDIELDEPANLPGEIKSEQQIQKILVQKSKEGFTKIINHIEDNENIYEGIFDFGSALKHYENFSDQNKYLGQPTSGDIQNVFKQNIPANAMAQSTSKLPNGEYAEFADESAVIGFTREITKSATGILTSPVYLKQISNLKKEYDKAKDIHGQMDAVAKAFIITGEFVSTITYTLIAAKKGDKGVKHHITEPPGESNDFSGAVAAAKTPTSIGASFGKVSSSTLIFTGKLIQCVNDCSKSNYGKTPLKNTGNWVEVSRAAAGAVKDWGGFLQAIDPTLAHTQDIQVVAAGGIAPAAVGALGAINFLQEISTLHQTNKKYQILKSEKSDRPNNLESGVAHQLDDLEHLDLLHENNKEIIDKAIPSVDMVIGAVQFFTFLVGTGIFNKEEGLRIATIMGGFITGIQLLKGGLLKYQKSKEDYLKKLIAGIEINGIDSRRIGESSNESSQDIILPEAQMRLNAIQHANNYLEDLEAYSEETEIDPRRIEELSNDRVNT